MGSFYLWKRDYLAHHGIKGQKWGIRRYQNEDGSLTAEGREHYGINVKNDPSVMKARLKTRARWLSNASRHMYKKLDDAAYTIASEMANEKEFEDRKKWSNNKKFKEDCKNELKKIFEKEKKAYDSDNFTYDTYDDYVKMKETLTKKYPGAKNLIDGFSPWEDIKKPEDIEKAFNEKSSEYYDKADNMKYYNSWLNNVINNDYYYEPDEKMLNESRVIVSMSRAKINDELAKKYGQDAIDRILKKGYSSLV